MNRDMNVAGQNDSSTPISDLVAALADKSGVVRERARNQLVETGSAGVVQALIAQLTNPNRQVRWEAAKALGAIADPSAAPALLLTLDDADADVRWVAALALIAMKQQGMLEVLKGLISRARSSAFCEGSHHVLRGLKRFDVEDVIAPVLTALEQSTPGMAAPIAAFHALQELNPT